VLRLFLRQGLTLCPGWPVLPCTAGMIDTCHWLR
jgi:hypothetical protein